MTLVSWRRNIIMVEKKEQSQEGDYQADQLEFSSVLKAMKEHTVTKIKSDDIVGCLDGLDKVSAGRR